MVPVPVPLTLGGPPGAAQLGRGPPSPGHTEQWAPLSQSMAVSTVLPLETPQPSPGSWDGLFVYLFRKESLAGSCVCCWKKEKALQTHWWAAEGDSSTHQRSRRFCEWHLLLFSMTLFCERPSREHMKITEWNGLRQHWKIN